VKQVAQELGVRYVLEGKRQQRGMRGSISEAFGLFGPCGLQAQVGPLFTHSVEFRYRGEGPHWGMGRRCGCRCRLGQATFAGTDGKGREAP
jgi:hypothetical protein